MADGYVGLFKVPDIGAQIVVLNNAIGNNDVTVAVAEEATGSKIISNATISLTNIDVISGGVTLVRVEAKHGAQPSSGTIRFKLNPQANDTITINSKVITFVASNPTGAQVLVGSDLFATMTNFVAKVNALQTADCDVYAYRTNESTCIVYSRTGGSGTTYAVATSSSARIAVPANLAGGVAEEDNSYYREIGTGTTNLVGPANDLTFNMKVNGLKAVLGIGWRHKFRIRFYNSDGQSATQLTDTGNEYICYGEVVLNAVTDLTELTEVLNLRATNAVDTEGTNGGTAIPAGGIIRLEWDDMTRYGGLNAHPIAKETGGVQATANISAVQLAQLTEYLVYMFISTAGSQPILDFPRASDANGTWYLVARTKNTYAEVQCPATGKNVGFWVGFGTPLTQFTMEAPKVQLAYAQYAS